MPSRSPQPPQNNGAPNSAPGATGAGCHGGPISDQQAQQLFNDFKNNSSIPFDYPVDCCYARANEMCRMAEARGIPCQKYWVFEQNWGTPNATSPLAPVRPDGSAVTFPNGNSNFQRTPVHWTYHVAPLIPVQHADGTVENMVFDPSIADRPLSEAEWRNIQGNPANTMERTTPSDVFFINPRTNAASSDPNDSKTNAAFASHRASRDAALDGERRRTP